MAVIPYDDVPAAAGAEKDPAVTIAGVRAREFYCGDARCDCATGHLVVGGVAMTIDLGTTRVDFIDERDAQIPAHEALRKTTREALNAGAINAMREHYRVTRDFGRDNHFRYVDWTQLKPNQDVAWEQINRHEGVPMFTINVTAAKRPPEGGEGSGEDGADTQQVQMLLGLGDSYCVEPKCDCGRAHFKVIAAPVNQPKNYQQLGVVRYDVMSGQMGVIERSPNYDPNQVYQLVHGLLQSQPELRRLFASRYHFLRQNLTPIVTSQRRTAGEARRQPTIGRNDACPCGSGKKYKRCHGAS